MGDLYDTIDPCPFCGNCDSDKFDIEPGFVGSYVECQVCGACGPQVAETGAVNDLESAVLCWNNRMAPSTPPEAPDADR